MSLHRVLVIAASATAVGCIPDLKSPPGFDDNLTEDGSSWEPPENEWEACEGPPADLQPDYSYAKGSVMPDLRMKDQNGDEVSLWQFCGKVIAIDLSTMWCGPCRQLASHVQETQDDYDGEGFVYLTMLPENTSGDVPNRGDLNDWANLFGIETPVLSDADRHSYDIVPSQAWPRIMVIGRDLRIAVDQVSPAEDAAIRAAIEAEL